MIIDAPFQDQCLGSWYQLRLIDSVASRSDSALCWLMRRSTVTLHSDLIELFSVDESIDAHRRTFQMYVFGFPVRTEIDRLSRTDICFFCGDAIVCVR